MKWKRAAKLQRLQEKVERVGGITSVGPDTPEWVIDLMLKQLDDCPECRALERARREH